MIHKLIDQNVLADFLKSNQALVAEIMRDQREREDKAQLARSDDQMLTAKEAAERLACSEDWLYRNVKSLPFAKKLGPKNLRFSKIGMEKWLASKHAS